MSIKRFGDTAISELIRLIKQTTQPKITVSGILKGGTDGISAAQPGVDYSDLTTADAYAGEGIFVASDSGDPVGLQISPAGVTEIGYQSTIQFSAAYVPEGSSDAAVTWASSNSGIISITSGGLATGTGRGSATITASGGGVSSTITLYCDAPIEATSIIDWALTSFNGSLTSGTTITNTRGNTAYNGTLTFPSSGAEASGDATGLTLGRRAYIKTNYNLKKENKWTMRCVVETFSPATTIDSQRVMMGGKGYPLLYYSKGKSTFAATLCGSTNKSELIVDNEAYSAGTLAALLYGVNVAARHDIVYVCDASTVLLYVDGVLAAHQSVYPFVNSTTIGLGDIAASGSYPLSSKVSKFQLFDYALTAEDVAELYAGGIV